MPKNPYRSTRNDSRGDKPERGSRDRDDRASDKPRGNTRYGSKKNEPTANKIERAYRDSDRGGSRNDRPEPRGDRDHSKRRNPAGKNFSTDTNFAKPRYPKRDDDRNDKRGGGFNERKPYGDNRAGEGRTERKPYQRRDDRSDNFSRDDNRSKPFRGGGGDNRGEGFGDRKSFGAKKPFEKRFGGEDRRSSHFEKREQDRSRSYQQRKEYGDDRRSPDNDAPRERKPYGDKPPRSFDRDNRNDAHERNDSRERKPYGNKPPGSFNRDERNDDSRERKPYEDRGGYKPSRNDQRYNPRRKDFGSDGDDRPKRSGYTDRDNQSKPRGAKPYGDKPFGKRSSEKPFERKPYGERPFREKPSFEDRDRSSGFKSPRKRIAAKENRFDDTEQSTEKLTPKTNEDGTLRLNKYIANAGIASRREADEHIAAGEVKVNGDVVTEMGHRVKPEDVITLRGKRVHYGKKVYILLNKPKDYITTTSDERDRKTVMEILGDATEERVYPVGRLDRNTTGLLLLTNDGELAQKLMHPSFRVRKVYQVTLDKPVTKEDMEKIAEGIELEDGKALVDEIAYADPKDKRVIGIDLHIGKNRIVRRIFESLGYDVLNLDRVLYAGLTKKDLPRGKWRFLADKEIGQLYQHMKRAPKKKKTE